MTASECAYKFELPERHYQNLSRNNLIELYRKYFDSGETHRALGFVIELLYRAPYDELYKKEALQCIAKVVANEFNPLLKKVLQIALTSKASVKDRAFILWQDTLHLDPLHAPLQELIEYFEDRKTPPPVDLDKVRPCLHDPFLQLGLKTMTFAHTPSEQALTHIRKHLLTHIDSLIEDDLDFLCALAIHNFYAEFTFYEDEEETDLVEQLAKDLQKEKPPTALKLVLLGCYRPLHLYFDGNNLPAINNDFFQEVIKTQIREPLKELEIRTTIPQISDIKDKISQDVQNMYEENPYPRWYDQNIVAHFYHDVDAEILIAGCGTGNFTSQFALLFPNSTFTAVDLSLSSLSYAQRKARELGAFNINFKQGDILELGKMGKKFDLIECSGVLHHMQDPEAGWRSLLDCLNPGGRMFIALYSELAREPVVKSRERIATMGYKTDPQSIRAFRKEVMEMETDHPIFPITFFRDFFSVSECRDLVFHIQEKRYTLPELKETMDRLGIHFLGFRELPTDKRAKYASMFPDDPEQNNLERWHEVETEYPNMFTGMYQFVCCRKDEIDTKNEKFEKIAATNHFSFSPKTQNGSPL